MKEYRIDLKSYDFYLKFQVYDSLKKMLEAASEYDTDHNGSGNIEDSIALFFGLPSALQKKELNISKKIFEREMGKIFLCKEHLSYGTIAHECLHAAFEFMRENVGYLGNFVNDDYSEQNEEFLVCIFTDIYEKILSTLIKNNFKIKQELI
jgi:hypothetical protein